MDEPEVPDDLWEPMPQVTYCQCAQTWVDVESPAQKTFEKAFAPGWSVSVRLQCPVCGHWTGPVPPAEK